MSPQVRDPKKLCSCIRGRIEKLIQTFPEPLKIIETLRTPERQRYYIEIGVSWTIRSKHLPQSPGGMALACDIAPSSLLKLKAWAPLSPLWTEMGEKGEGLGLKWGGRWKQKDLVHFELPKCLC